MNPFDRPFFLVTLVLVLVGFFIFSSASLGLLARDGATFSSVAVSQLVFGIGFGTVALFVLSRVPYRVFRRFAPHFFIVSFFLTLLVFVPGIGYSAGGASRWIDVFGLSFQPGEALKISYILLLAWYFSAHHKSVGSIRHGLLPYAAVTALVGVVLLAQPDTGTFLVIGASGGAMYLAAGARLRHLGLLLLVGLLGLTLIVMLRPYLMDRVTTFLDPSSDPSGSGYQIRQSLIAIGSGGLVGRGFGQSIQKFNYLPEPIGDSIFSVAVEEFGFVGSLVLLALFVFFGLRGLQIAARAPDRFGGLLVVGVVILVLTQSFANIASMLGIIPLTGEPLAFISHGGTSLMFTLASVGIILNISRYGNKQVSTI